MTRWTSPIPTSPSGTRISLGHSPVASLYSAVPINVQPSFAPRFDLTYPAASITNCFPFSNVGLSMISSLRVGAALTSSAVIELGRLRLANDSFLSSRIPFTLGDTSSSFIVYS
eukprot:TRINITY_DN15550_c0_g1_i7.p5 TRINITY_DN15550_c0_g1~~TRINITY_DN15550_c0_g1_i7.p5  ORF type:complete len:114 (-),score=11.57 TRINITY_DN15550_c0_g1_i7:153-494(-)